MDTKKNIIKKSKETHSKNSWNTMVDMIPQNQPTPTTNIIALTQISLSSLTTDTLEQKRRKIKDKVDEYIKSWEKKISTINNKNIQPEKLP